MSKQIVMVQPGKLGDILVLAPIAKHYNDMGYEVLWPVYEDFLTTLERFPYVTPISFGISLNGYYNQKRLQFVENQNIHSSVEMFKNIYSYINEKKLEYIDPCFFIPGHDPESQNYEKVKEYKKSGLNWIQLKYDLCNVPLEKRWNLEYSRDLDKEEKLFNIVNKYCIKQGYTHYSIVHTYDRNLLNNLEVQNEIPFSYIAGYTIFDWRKVLEESSELFCIDSSLANYVEVSDFLNEKKKHHIGTEEKHFVPFMRNILKNNWASKL